MKPPTGGATSKPKALAVSARQSETGCVPLRLPDCYELRPPVFTDDRGTLTKPFSRSTFEAYGIATSFAETFYTVSGENVLRGMHIQLPPADHAKLVYCVAGRIFDVALDVRAGIPTFGQHLTVELGSRERNAVYLASGVAHGFYVLEAPAIVVYQVTSVHAPALDAGIAWNTFGVRWPTNAPLLSDRDRSLPSFDRFVTPFTERNVAHHSAT